MSVVVAEGVVEVTADGKSVPKDLRRDIEAGGGDVERSGSLLGGRILTGLGTGLATVGKVTAVALGAAALAVGVGVGAIITNGVAFNASMQNYTAAFTPLLGGADAAQAKLQELSSFAASTPFEMTGLADASQTLLSFGLAGDDLLPTLQMLGDISQGNQEKMSGLALVFGQVQSAGRLMGQDVLQMINQGFNPLVEISKMTGESMVDLKARMEAGGISFDEVRAAMQHATAEGGMFFGSMELGSKTLTGSWSSTKDGANILSGALVSTLTPALTGILSLGINPLLGGLVDLVNGVEGAEGTVTSASQVLLNQVEGLGDVAKDIATNLGTVVTAVAPALSSVIGTVISSLATALPSIIDLAGQLVLSIVTAIADNAPALVSAAVPVLLNFATGLIGMLPTLIGVGVNILFALITGITQSLPTLIPGVVTAIVDALTYLFAPQNLTALLSAGLQLIMGLAQGIITALPSLIEALPGIILGIVTFLIDSIPMLIDAGIQLLLSLVGALPDIITGIVEAIPKIITGIITAVIGSIPQLISAGVKLFIALIENLPTIIVSIVNAVPQIIQGLVTAFTNPSTIAQLAKAGGDLIRGLWQGISDLGSWLWGKVSGFFDGLVGGIKSFFGIHSPSTLFRDQIGAMLGTGMAEGILGTQGLVAAAAGSLADAALGAMDGIGITMNGPGSGFNDGSGVGFGDDGQPPAGAMLVGSGGDTYVIESVTIDASSVKDFTDVVDVFKNLPRVARAGRGKG